jgi:farnesyl diphosphate synthase
MPQNFSSDFVKGAVAGVGASFVAASAYCIVKHILLKPSTTSSSKILTPEQLTPEALRQAFLDRFEELTKLLLDDMRKHYEVPEVHLKYIDRLMRYNCLGGKYNRALFVIRTLVNLRQASKQSVTEEEMLQAQVLGWCIEWLQAFFLVADDIMDQSLTRRGQPCWYKLPDVKMSACNDYLILESHIYRMLKHYFEKDQSKYVRLLDLFHETAYQTELGQLSDLRSQSENPDLDTKGLDLNLFNLAVYKRIVKYKTAFYSFYLPIACGLIVAGVTEDEIFDETRDICVQMGEYFQIQDDYLDCYADPEVLGKIGRDIEEGKCCWLVVQALQRVNPEQLAMLQQNYGKDDPEKVKQVKQLYKDLNMTQIFSEYEDKAEKEMNDFINKSILKKLGKEKVYTDALALVLKRKK